MTTKRKKLVRKKLLRKKRKAVAPRDKMQDIFHPIVPMMTVAVPVTPQTAVAWLRSDIELSRNGRNLIASLIDHLVGRL